MRTVCTALAAPRLYLTRRFFADTSRHSFYPLLVSLIAIVGVAFGSQSASAAAPTISGFSPTSGPIGTSVTITGTNFSATKTSDVVKFNGTAATVTSATTVQLVVVVPTGATNGKVSVTVASSTATSSGTFTVTAPPTITNFSPTSGPVGTSITITGTNFSATKTNDTFKLNGTLATVSSATTTQLIVPVPSGAITGTMTVTVGGLTATSSSNFTVTASPPTIASFAPSSAPVGTSITITGTNFSTTAANNAVKFNGTAATVSSSTATQLVVAVPAGGTTGKISVTVSGQSATSGASFTVTPPGPTISGFSPLGAPVGAPVTITGANFSATPASNTVTFNGRTAGVTFASPTQLSVTVPNTATTGPIAVKVAGQTGNSGSSFSVLTAPFVSSYSPQTGTGGTVVTISGANFDPSPLNNFVTINGSNAQVTAASSTQLTVTVPNDATSGDIVLAVSGLSTTIGSFSVHPTISSFSPASGGSGLPIIVNGTNFDPNPANNVVFFNCANANVTFASPTQLVTSVPSGAISGSLSVSVNGQEVSSTGSFTVPLPTITGFTPIQGAAGTVVTVTGTNFDAVSSNDAVNFNGSYADVISATPTQIITSVPSGARSGLISVEDACSAATSSASFTVVSSSPPPTISTFSPRGGPIGTQVTITGTGFSPSVAGNVVAFNGVPSNVLSATTTQLVAAVPTGTATGFITVTTASGSAIGDYFHLPSTITGFTPTTGAPNTIVTITGTNLLDAGATINGTTAPTISSSQTQLVVAIPFTTTGPFLIGSATSSSAFTIPPPAVNSCSPSSGTVGTVVTVLGANFSADAVNDAVLFNGTPGTVTANSPTQLSVTVPPGATTGPLSLVTPTGTSANCNFTLALNTVPIIARFSPSGGPVGTVITITGSNFDPNPVNDAVVIGGVAATVSSASASRLVSVVPSGATTGTVRVTVGGTAAASSSSYTVTSQAPPVITGFSPTAGQNNAAVTITGSNFDGSILNNNRVAFNGVSAQVTVASSTQITALAPSNGTSGPISVTVAGLTGTSNATFTASPVTLEPVPALGTPGTFVVFPGANFDPVASNDTATVDGLAAQVIAATPAELVVQLPNRGAVTPGRSAYVGDTSNGLVSTNTVEFAPPQMSCFGQPPIVTGFSPASGRTGIPITINGAGFGGFYPTPSAVSVSINQQVATILSNSGTQIVVSAPASASGLIAVGNTPGCTIGYSSSAFNNTSPAIQSISPGSGNTATQVTITGTNFDPTPGNDNVTFNGVPAVVTSASATQLVTSAPTGVETGPVAVTVAGSQAIGPSFTVSAAPPTITGFNPASGPDGTAITITGTNFDPVAVGNTVTVGLNPSGLAAMVTSASSTQLVITVPTDTTSGLVSVTVGNQTATSTGEFTDTTPTRALTTFSPTSGVPGSSVTLSGTNFGASDAVYFWPGVAAAVTFINATQLHVTVPANALSGPVALVYGPEDAVFSTTNFVVPAPSIGSFSPTGGPIGTSVTLIGSNFSSALANNAVAINGTSATVVSASATQLVATVPSGATPGPITVTVGAQTATSSANFAVALSPAISRVAPTAGPIGALVVISGSNFDPIAANDAVSFHGTSSIIYSASSSQLITSVPTGAIPGLLSVVVDGQAATGAGNFTVVTPGPAPAITSFTPASAHVGTSITISGANFDPTAANNLVMFNGVIAPVTSASATQLIAAVPSNATIGPGPISVTVAGQTATSSSSLVVLGPPPTITSFSPTSGPVGTQVSLLGTNFDVINPGNNIVKFNGTQLDSSWTVQQVSGANDKLTVTVPHGATTGLISLTVSGQTTMSSAAFTVVSTAPAITGFAPASGPVGTQVTITGTNFSATAANNSVTFNGTIAAVSIATATQLTVAVPSGAATGPINVSVAGQIGTSSSSFTVTAAGPTVSSFTPSTGTVGTQVTISGTNLYSSGNVPVVSFNGTSAFVNSASATQIVTTVPTGAASGPIAVRINGQTVTTSTNFSVVLPGSGSVTISISAVNPEPAVVSQNYTVQVTVTGAAAAPTGTILVLEPNGECLINLPITSCTLSGDPAVGEVMLTAIYSGDANYQSATTSVEHIINPSVPTEMCGLDPLATPNAASGFVPISQLSGIAYTPGLANDITGNGNLSVTITAPTAGATISDSNVDVVGTFVGPTNTGIVVNGMIAITTNGHFLARAIPIATGANNLSVAATTLTGATATETIQVTRNGATTALVTLAIADGSSRPGFAPRAITFDMFIGSLPAGASVQSVSIDVDGDGTYDYTAPTLAALPNTYSYNRPGAYTAQLKVVDSNGITYLANRTVLIQDAAATRNMLCDIFAYLKDRLAAMDATGASEAYQSSVSSQYEAQFVTFGSNMPKVVPMLGYIGAGMLGPGYAEITLVVDNPDQTRSGYPLRMTLGADGVWRISEM